MNLLVRLLVVESFQGVFVGKIKSIALFISFCTYVNVANFAAIVKPEPRDDIDVHKHDSHYAAHLRLLGVHVPCRLRPFARWRDFA